MIILINSSKTLDFESPISSGRSTTAEFQDDAAILIEHLRKLSLQDLMQLMGISEKLALMNARRYTDWRQSLNDADARPSLLAYKGDVYSGLAVADYTAEDWRFAQMHVRILAGLYGILRPLDLIQPYRLEMGTRLPTASGQNLYQFWGSRITQSLRRALQETASDAVVNLASAEYFKTVDIGLLKTRVITPVFKQRRGGKLKTIAVYTKKARGLMCDFIIRNRLRDAEGIKNFEREGYRFEPSRSSKTKWFFIRE